MTSSPTLARSLDFDSGASFSGMTTGSGSNPSQSSQMSMDHGSTSQNGSTIASTSASAIQSESAPNTGANATFALAEHAAYGNDPSSILEGPWSTSHETTEAKIPRDIADPHEQWQYEMRREAQQIVPGLYLGPYQSSRLLEPLQRLGITHILVVYDQREKAFLKPRFPENFTYLVLEVRDATDQNVIGLFPQVRQFIDEAIQSGGKVLIHCGDGISRSPALVIAYLMTKFNVSHEEAFLHVQSRRFCINPNLNFQRQMDAYEDIHSASLAMTQYMAKIQANGRPNGSASMQATHRRKRDTETDSGDETLQIDEDLRDRNLHAQRKRLASPGGGVHHFVGEQSMDTS